MYAAIRIRGSIGLKKELKDTLKMLRLNRKMHCALVKDDEVMRGMLQKAKDYITWGNIDDETLKLLLHKRGRKKGNKRITKEEAEVLFDKIKAEKKMVFDIKPVFRLSPPSKGFRGSIKQHYPRGELGNRREKINELLKKMI